MFSGCNNKCERILMHHRRSRGNVSKTQELLYSLYDWFPVTSCLIPLPCFVGVHYNKPIKQEHYEWGNNLCV